MELKKTVAESVVVLMGEKGWSFSKTGGKSLVESSKCGMKNNSVCVLWK